MNWQERSDLGLALVGDVHDLLHVEDAWRIDEPRGFQWWPADFAQHIWADMGLYHHEQAVYRMHVETDLISGRGHHEDFELALETAIDQCTFSAIIYDKARDVYRLHSSVYASPENIQWLKKTFFAAAALQIAEARDLVATLSRGAAAVPATSAHPRSGLRSQVSPVVGAREQFFKPNGGVESRWRGVEEWPEMERLMKREALSIDSDHATRLHAEFPWQGPGVSLTGAEPRVQLEITTEEPHAILGNGLHFTLTLPLALEAKRVAHLALELNEVERKDWKRCHMLGSWCDHKDQLTFRCFVPNTLYNPELLPKLGMDMFVRAAWADEWCLQNRASAPEALRASLE